MVEGKLNGTRYSDILNENLVSQCSDLKLAERFTFQHDNDSKHTVKDTQEGSRSNSVKILEETSQNPNLNKIYCLWRDLKIDSHPTRLS